jgi:hypothetical protein
MKKLIVELEGYGTVAIQEFYDVDTNQSGVEVFELEKNGGQHIHTEWGTSIPDIDDPDYNELWYNLLYDIDCQIY